MLDASRGQKSEYPPSLFIRGIQTFDFSRKTTNAVLSDLQIVDVDVTIRYRGVGRVCFLPPPSFVRPNL